MDKQETFLRHTARSRLILNKTKKIARLAEDDPDRLEMLVDMAVTHWKQGNNCEDALRYMETEAKTYCKKLGEQRF